MQASNKCKLWPGQIQPVIKTAGNWLHHTELSLAIRVELEKHGDGEGPNRGNYACGRWNWDTLTLAAKGRSQAGKVRRRRWDATLRGKRHRRPPP